jgi:hypothetical protein
MTNAKHDYTLTAKEGKWEVKVSPTTHYGYYEHDDFGEGGGLWFNGIALVDYDGRACLPRDVAVALKRMGYTVDQSAYVGDPI